MKIVNFIEVINDSCLLEMLLVEGGKFMMGDDEEDKVWQYKRTKHPVQVSSFYITKYLVTQALWNAVMGVDNNPSYFRGDSRPVETVSWNDAQGFIAKLNDNTGKSYRLPTEAEWEYAAKGGEEGGDKNFLYSGSNKLKEVGWYVENSYKETKEVGLLRPNALGINDMSGNVYEFCQDHWSESYYQECLNKGVVKDPAGPEKGTYRVIRGGGWDDSPEYCRCTFRGGWAPDDRNVSVGFRLVLPFQ